jgi:hypothetical protein
VHYRHLSFEHAELKANTPFSLNHFYQQLGNWKLSSVGLFVYEPGATPIYYKGIYSYLNGKIVFDGNP